MPNMNNPAGRLYALLEQAASKGDEIRARDMWADIFQTQDDTDLWHCIYEMHELYKETIATLKGIENLNKPIYIEPLTRIPQAIHPLRLDLQWKHFKTALTENVMTTLRICDDILSHVDKEVPVDISELMILLDEVQYLIDDILNGSLDTDIKHFLIEQLNIVRQAIIDYKIRGSFSLRKAFETTLGGILVNLQRFKEIENTEEGKSYRRIWEKFANIAKPTYGTAKFLYKEKDTIIQWATKLYEWFSSSGSSPLPPSLPPAP